MGLNLPPVLGYLKVYRDYSRCQRVVQKKLKQATRGGRGIYASSTERELG